MEGETQCPLCDEQLSGVRVEVALHLVVCGAQCLQEERGKRATQRGAEEENQEAARQEEEEEEVSLTKKSKRKSSPSVPKKPSRGRGSKRSRRDEEGEEEESGESAKQEEAEEEEEEEEVQEEVKTPTKKRRTNKQASSSAMDVSSPVAAKLKFATEQEYDAFLASSKQGRFMRVGSWAGMSKGILHRCADQECAREWKPSPAQAVADDYYCPSCVLHHRNNEDRFADPRLEWTRHVPNTFYVFSITDPKTKKKLTKFGRTQHLDAWKRYPKKERDQYKMELLLCLRGKLEVTTKIENWWKSESEEKDYFCKFSDANFHGKDECVDLPSDVLEAMLEQSRNMLAAGVEDSDE